VFIYTASAAKHSKRMCEKNASRTHLLHSVVCYLLSHRAEIYCSCLLSYLWNVLHCIVHQIVTVSHQLLFDDSCLAKTGSVMSAAACDSSPQSLGSGSERIFTTSDRHSAVSSVDDMDTGYPSRLIDDFFLF